MSADLHRLGVAELGRALAAREVSSVELTSHLLGRIAAHEQLGAVLAVEPEAALAAARAADARIAQGDAAPLVGVPIAHKDIFVTRALPTTASASSGTPSRVAASRTASAVASAGPSAATASSPGGPSPARP